MENEKIELRVVELAGTSFCVASEHGFHVCQELKRAFSAEKHVTLSFQGTDIITSAFLNTAIGALFQDYDCEFLQNHLNCVDIHPNDQELLNYVIDNAKRYYQDPQRYEKVLQQIVEDE